MADWKSLYDDVSARSEEERTAAARALADKDGEIAGLVHERDTVRERVAALEQAAASEPAQDRPLLTKERDTALKLLIGMAVGGYKFDPSAKRNDKLKDITDDLDAVGLPLDDGTVRKWLREAVQLLPGGRLNDGGG